MVLGRVKWVPTVRIQLLSNTVLSSLTGHELKELYRAVRAARRANPREGRGVGLALGHGCEWLSLHTRLLFDRLSFAGLCRATWLYSTTGTAVP